VNGRRARDVAAVFATGGEELTALRPPLFQTKVSGVCARRWLLLHRAEHTFKAVPRQESRRSHAEHMDCRGACDAEESPTEVKTGSSRCSFTTKRRKCNLPAAERADLAADPHPERSGASQDSNPHE
jgi:hypothetical protein